MNRTTPLCALWDFPPTKGEVTKWWKRWCRTFDVVKVAVDAEALYSGDEDVRLQHSDGKRTLADAVRLCRLSIEQGNPVLMILTATYLAAGEMDGSGWHQNGRTNLMAPERRELMWQRVRERYGDVLFACQDDYEIEVQIGANQSEREALFVWYLRGAERVAASWPVAGPHYVMGGDAGSGVATFGSFAAYFVANASTTLRRVSVFDFHDYFGVGRAYFHLRRLARFTRTGVGEHFTSNNNRPDVREARYHAAMARETGQLFFAVPGGQFGVPRWRRQDTRNWAVWDWRGRVNRTNWAEVQACAQALDGTLEGAVVLPPGTDYASVMAHDAQDDAVRVDGVPSALRRSMAGRTVDWQKPLGVGHHGQESLPTSGEAWRKFEDGTLEHD